MHYKILAISIVLSFFIGLLGMNRKWGFWGYFFGSILLTPIIGILLIFASDKRPNN